MKILRDINMKRILLIGSKGVIGSIIRKELSEYHITNFDTPDHDARDYADLIKIMSKHDVVIHLGWDTKTENWKSETINPDNALMTFNVYKAALEAKVPRVIMASSVHADDFSHWKGSELMSANAVSTPDSPYGASKVFMEALGRYYAKKGLEVVCIRFAGLNSDNRPSSNDPLAQKKWFSHHDCGELIKTIVEAAAVPNNFVVMYGVSNNPGRIHDVSNPFGWKPKDGSSSSPTSFNK